MLELGRICMWLFPRHCHLINHMAKISVEQNSAYGEEMKYVVDEGKLSFLKPSRLLQFIKALRLDGEPISAEKL